MPQQSWRPLDEFWFPLRGLTRQHQSLQELRTQLGNQLHAHTKSIYSVALVEHQLKTTLPEPSATEGVGGSYYQAPAERCASVEERAAAHKHQRSGRVMRGGGAGRDQRLWADH